MGSHTQTSPSIEDPVDRAEQGQNPYKPGQAWKVLYTQQQCYKGTHVQQWAPILTQGLILYPSVLPSSLFLLFQIALSRHWWGSRMNRALSSPSTPFLTDTFSSSLRQARQGALQCLSNYSHGEQSPGVDVHCDLFLTSNLWCICHQQKLLSETRIPKFRMISLSKISPNVLYKNSNRS